MSLRTVPSLASQCGEPELGPASGAPPRDDGDRGELLAVIGDRVDAALPVDHRQGVELRFVAQLERIDQARADVTVKGGDLGAGDPWS